MTPILHKPDNFLVFSKEKLSNQFENTNYYLQSIQKSFLKNGLHVVAAEPKDSPAIVDFRNSRFSSPNPYTPYWMYHLTHFGNSTLLKSDKGEIKACLLEVSYSDPYKTSYQVLIAVAEEYSGKQIAPRLIQYVSLKAFIAGSKFVQGTIAPDNYSSLASFLNHCGAILTEYAEDFCGFGPRFIFKIPLSLQAIFHQKIDKEQLKSLYTKQIFSATDFQFIEANKIDEVQKVYKETNNRIIALFKEPITHKPIFLTTSFPEIESHQSGIF